MSETVKRHENAGLNTELAQNSQVQEAKLRLYTVAVKKANESQRKVVQASSQKFCCV